MMKRKRHLIIALAITALSLAAVRPKRTDDGPGKGEAVKDNDKWIIDTQQAWEAQAADSKNIRINEGLVHPTSSKATFKSKMKRFDKKRSAQSIVFDQSPDWQNWKPIPNAQPSNLRDAPVFLSLGPNNYWIFGRYGPLEGEESFQPKEAKLEGFDVELTTTPDPHQFNAPGSNAPHKKGYHAWQSRDMVNWVHHGSVTPEFARWVTTAEYGDGKAYIYYDYPNDQDPHLYIDEDLTDGKPGKNMGLAFRDPSDGSDCAFIRDLEGKFHVIYEDWSPINARKHSWDSPLAGHAVSNDGINDFTILEPPVDERTEPTGDTGTYKHPHWLQHPDWDTNIAKYEIHKPEQNAFGDWAAIAIGGQYYLFCDFDPAKGHMGVAWFTSESLYKPFRRCGRIGKGHPDPDIGFAEGRFYLITQFKNDFISPGPWVEKVTARVGVDTTNDGEIDTWTDWTEVKETYDYIDGFAKQISKTSAEIDLSSLPSGYGFQFEFKTTQTTDNGVLPVMDKITFNF
ncbi:MAG: hypothetical protein KGY70_09390 [Bacteroidales bacterium]|nr:hypothetical protein [Bacteroidales bacterium]